MQTDPSRVFAQPGPEPLALSDKAHVYEKKNVLTQRESANISQDCPVGRQHVEDFSATLFTFFCASKKNRSILLLSASVYWFKLQG